MAKIYGLFCPYHKSEIMDSSEPEYKELPSYPREFRRVRKYPENVQLQDEDYIQTPTELYPIYGRDDSPIGLKYSKIL